MNYQKTLLLSLISLFSALVSTSGIAQTHSDSAALFLNSELPENEDFLNLLVSTSQSYYPEKDQFDSRLYIAKKEKALANYDFLNNFLIRGNLNEFTINPPDETIARNLFYPRYNLGVSFTLGTFFTQPINKQIAKEEFYLKENEKEMYNLKLRSEVLIRYMSFKSLKSVFLIHIKALEDATSKLALVENQFKNDEVSYEAYLDGLTNVNNQKIKTLNAEKDYQIAKIQLEELIGKKIEDLINEYKKSCE